MESLSERVARDWKIRRKARGAFPSNVHQWVLYIQASFSFVPKVTDSGRCPPSSPTQATQAADFVFTTFFRPVRPRGLLARFPSEAARLLFLPLQVPHPQGQTADITAGESLLRAALTLKPDDPVLAENLRQAEPYAALPAPKPESASKKRSSDLLH